MRIKSFADASLFLGERNSRPIRGKRSTMVIRGPLGEIAIKYHCTRVVTYWPNGRIVLNSGGFRTVTTKRRMCEHTPATIYQSSRVWYVRLNGETICFTDQMSINLNTLTFPHDFKNQKSLEF